MSSLEDYTAKAAASLAAGEAATNARDRAFHQRAHAIWRKLIANVAAAEQRAAIAPPRPTKTASAASERAAKQAQLSTFRR